jgi:hypothetical protein
VIVMSEPIYRELCADLRRRVVPVWPGADPDHRYPTDNVPVARTADQEALSEPDTVRRCPLPACFLGDADDGEEEEVSGLPES